MNGQEKRRRSAALAKCMKLIGYVTSPETLTGKAFTKWERGLTSVMDAIARNDAYLNFAGRMMERGFRARADSVRMTEEALRRMRLPTASDVDDLRAEVRRLNNQVEAASAQLELVLDAIEALRAAPTSGEGRPSSNG